MVASDSPSLLPPPASSEMEMVDASAVHKLSRSPGLSDGDSSGSAPSLKKGTKKGVQKCGVTRAPGKLKCPDCETPTCEPVLT